MTTDVKSCVGYLLIVLAAGLLRPLPACAQQPFVTDDTNVTPKGKLHFEFTNEFDILQRSSFPNLKQILAALR